MKKTALLLMTFLLTVSCVETGKIETDLTDIKAQIWRIQKEQSEQSQMIQALSDDSQSDDSDLVEQADYLANAEEIKSTLNILFERIKDLNEKMTLIISKMQGGSSTGEISSNTSEGDQTQNTLTPGDENSMFSLAYTDYINEKFEVAALGFSDFISNYPDSDKVDNAYYRLGLCYFELGKYRESIRKFDRVLKDYPDSDVYVEAMLRKGLSLFEISVSVAVVQLQELIEKYPLSQEARIARKKLDEVGARHQ